MAKYCTNCGRELREGDRFCANCGAPGQQDATSEADAANTAQLAASSVTTSVTAKDQIAAVPCPIDGASDAVRKVTTVVSGGSWSGSVGGWSSEAQTALSKRLAHPAPTYIEPDQAGKWFLFWGCGGFLVFSSIVPIGALIINGFPKSVVWSIVGLLVCLMWVVATPVAIYIWIRDVRVRAKAAYEAALSQWKHEQVIWEQLYYCHRHDMVFLPGGSPVAADYMRQLLVRAIRPTTQSS